MDAITLGILAGGRGVRLGGIDKALLAHRGERLLDRIVRGLGSGIDARLPVLLSRAGEGVAASPIEGFRTVADLRPGALGPLAGLEALLATARTPWLLSAPVDLGHVPAGLGTRLRGFARLAGQQAGDAPRACVVRDLDGLQPLVALWPVATSLVAVRQALDAGRLAVHAVFDSLPHVELDIRPERLGNLNLPGDFEAA